MLVRHVDPGSRLSKTLTALVREMLEQLQHGFLLGEEEAGKVLPVAQFVALVPDVHGKPKRFKKTSSYCSFVPGETRAPSQKTNRPNGNLIV